MVELDHIILKVNELDKSVVFYTSVLGFEMLAGRAVTLSYVPVKNFKRSSSRPGVEGV